MQFNPEVGDVPHSFTVLGSYGAPFFLQKKMKRLRHLVHLLGRPMVMSVSATPNSRLRFLQKLFSRNSNGPSTERISAEELRDSLGRGDRIMLLDLRHPLDLLPDPRFIPGSIRVRPQDLERDGMRIPHDREVVIYCTCQTDAAVERATDQLRRRGISNFRILDGGYQRWRDLGLPLESYVDHPVAARRKTLANIR
jgi:rhodanese-related sulfurtransferase